MNGRNKNRITALPVLVGHPLAPIGRGEDIRSSFRCLQRVGFPAAIYDVSPPPYYSDTDLAHEFKDHLVRSFSSNINIFYLNGDEIGNILDRIAGILPVSAYNVIYPQWELGIYPKEWSAQFARFDEVWAPSFFVYQCLRQATTKPVFHLPLSTQIEIGLSLGRRYFCLPENAYLFLFCFDLRSFMERKNPLSVVKTFGQVIDARKQHDMRLVIKLHGRDSAKGRAAFRQLMAEIEQCNARDNIIVIDRVFTDNEIKNLIRCCDCFVSLHRSEGFGRGMAEAMLLGRPVVATGYSGNLDFMNASNSCLVRYRMIEIGKDHYPHGDDQVWADPDIEHAASHMLRLVDDRDYGRALGKTASQDMRTHFSNRAIGLRYRRRIDEIFEMNNNSEPPSEISWTQSENQSSAIRLATKHTG